MDSGQRQGKHHLDDGTERGRDRTLGPSSFQYNNDEDMDGAEECHATTGVILDDVLLKYERGEM